MKSYQPHQRITHPAAKIYIPALMLMLAAFGNQVAAQESSFTVNAQTNPLKSYAVPSNRESHPFFIDIDGDGDLDCFSGEFTNSLFSKIYFYRNEGNSKSPDFKLVTGQNNPLDNVEANRLSIPYFIDIDGDGDNDCFIGEGTTGAIMYYKNTGSATQPSFQKQSAAFNPLSMVKFSTSNVANPAFTDIDGDGDFDCLVVDEAGYLNYFKNTGNATKPVFVHIDNEDNPFNFLTNRGSIYNVSFEDWDKDGLVDLFINTDYYRNVGTQRRPKFSTDNGDDAPAFQSALPYQYTYNPLRWVDLNNDGKPEVFQGNANGSFLYQTIEKKGIIRITNVAASVFPNPSTSVFTLTISPAAPSVIRVTNVEGKLLSTQITSSGTVKIGAELKRGVYILQVMQNNKVVYNQKIIKE